MKPAPSVLFLKDEVLNDDVELFFFAYRDFARVGDRHLESQELGRAHFRALSFISRRPNLPVTELISTLGITKQSLNRVLKTLIDKKFVTLTKGTRDRRQRLLNLTDEGASLAGVLAQTQRARFAHAYRTAGPEAVEGFRRVLASLVTERERQAHYKGMLKG